MLGTYGGGVTHSNSVGIGSTVMNNMEWYEVNEGTAKVMRVWEELGGPTYLSFANAREIFDQMDIPEQLEVPSWAKCQDLLHYQIGQGYELPKRFQRKIRQ